jgi:hypothetical protein
MGLFLTATPRPQKGDRIGFPAQAPWTTPLLRIIYGLVEFWDFQARGLISAHYLALNNTARRRKTLLRNPQVEENKG